MQSLLYLLEELSTVFHVRYCPKPLKNVGGAQSPGPRLLEPLFIEKLSRQRMMSPKQRAVQVE